jgi:hypothetical protein
MSTSIDNSIGSANQHACYAESSPDIRASHFPRDTATETKNEGKLFGRRCSVPLPWSSRESPKVEAQNNQKDYPKNDCFCKTWQVGKRRIRDKYPQQQIHAHGPTVAGTALGDRRVLCEIALAAQLFAPRQIKTAR